jgi:peptidoglycan/xylan/chitin deacetylase (PgdA/CDA1 family)
MFCSTWSDEGWDGRGHQRQVNAVLGSLCRLHYPGLVTDKHGQQVPVTNWKMYALSTDVDHGNAQNAVWVDFWVRFHKLRIYLTLDLIYGVGINE